MRGFKDEDKHLKQNNDELIQMEGTLVRQTEKAYLIAIDDDPSNEQWLPKSQLVDVLAATGSIVFKCPRWIAEQRKLV